jgi:hypothetical protein
MLLCCGGVFWLGSTMVPKETKVPAEVAAVGQQILQFDIPAGFEGTNAVTIDNFFVTVQTADFKRKQGDAQLQLMKMEIKIAGMDKQQQDFKGQFQRPADAHQSLDIKKTEKRDFVIAGKKVAFRFSEAVDPTSNVEFRVVEGEMGTPPVNVRLLKFVIQADDYDEDEVVKMIESIH